MYQLTSYEQKMVDKIFKKNVFNETVFIRAVNVDLEINTPQKLTENFFGHLWKRVSSADKFRVSKVALRTKSDGSYKYAGLPENITITDKDYQDLLEETLNSPKLLERCLQFAWANTNWENDSHLIALQTLLTEEQAKKTFNLLKAHGIRENITSFVKNMNPDGFSDSFLNSILDETVDATQIILKRKTTISPTMWKRFASRESMGLFVSKEAVMRDDFLEVEEEVFVPILRLYLQASDRWAKRSIERPRGKAPVISSRKEEFERKLKLAVKRYWEIQGVDTYNISSQLLLEYALEDMCSTS